MGDPQSADTEPMPRNEARFAALGEQLLTFLVRPYPREAIFRWALSNKITRTEAEDTLAWLEMHHRVDFRMGHDKKKRFFAKGVDPGAGEKVGERFSGVDAKAAFEAPAAAVTFSKTQPKRVIPPKLNPVVLSEEALEDLKDALDQEQVKKAVSKMNVGFADSQIDAGKWLDKEQAAKVIDRSPRWFDSSQNTAPLKKHTHGKKTYFSRESLERLASLRKTGRGPRQATPKEPVMPPQKKPEPSIHQQLKSRYAPDKDLREKVLLLAICARKQVMTAEEALAKIEELCE